MALLSTDDVLNKRFSITKFREGYDQDEVDDFLDEIVETIGKLQDEKEELLAKLEQLGNGGAVQEPVATPEVAIEETVEETVVEEAPAVPAVPVAPTADEEPAAATSVLVLAQKVHDEYVNNARQEADRIVSEARDSAAKIVKDAENVSARTMEKLSADRAEVESTISRLEGFEADYRTQIRGHLEGLLKDLNTPIEM